MKEHNPFSLYDFLGYIFPGFISIFLFYSIQKLEVGFDYRCIITNLKMDFSFNQLIILIIVSYSAGHILNFLSGVIIEKYSYWKYDYPSKYLMKIQHTYPYFRGKFHVRIWRFMIASIIFPVVVGDYIFGEKLNFKDVYVKGLDDFLINAVKKKAGLLFKKLKIDLPQGQLREYDYHRIFSHYVFQNSESTNIKTSNYIAIYGYLRCLSLILCLSFWVGIAHLCVSIFKYESFKEYLHNQIYLICFLIFLFTTSYICFMAFMKFYRRYSLENLMAIVTMNIE